MNNNYITDLNYAVGLNGVFDIKMFFLVRICFVSRNSVCCVYLIEYRSIF